MQPRKIFSIPLNPALSGEAFFKVYVPFIKKYRAWIYDVYFTVRCGPFKQDAMGIDINEEEYDNLIDNAVLLNELTGVTISATFNNIRVNPSTENRLLFQEEFKKIYDKGIRSITLPFSHWTQAVKHQYPDLFIKNTILWRVRTGQQFVNAVEFGFDYINLDRELCRDRDALETIVRAKNHVKQKYGKDIKIALLANEGCLGNCPLLDEHSLYNTLKTPAQVSYFDEPISFWSCKNWFSSDPSIPFKTANFTPWREDWDELLEYIDVIKMHGRENIDKLNQTMHLVKNYCDGNDIIEPQYIQYLKEFNIPEKRMLGWRAKIKNCKFECWDCNACDDISKNKIDRQPILQTYERPIMFLKNYPFKKEEDI